MCFFFRIKICFCLILRWIALRLFLGLFTRQFSTLNAIGIFSTENQFMTSFRVQNTVKNTYYVNSGDEGINMNFIFWNFHWIGCVFIKCLNLSTVKQWPELRLVDTFWEKQQTAKVKRVWFDCTLNIGRNWGTSKLITYRVIVFHIFSFLSLLVPVCYIDVQ